MSQTTPYRKALNREQAERSEDRRNKFVEIEGVKVRKRAIEDVKVCDTDAVAEGSNDTACPKYNYARVRSPTRRTLEVQRRLFKAENQSKVYFSRGLNNLDWELANQDKSRREYDQEATKSTSPIGEVGFSSSPESVSESEEVTRVPAGISALDI
jgi:hypothetical protein